MSHTDTHRKDRQDDPQQFYGHAPDRQSSENPIPTSPVRARHGAMGEEIRGRLVYLG